MKKRLQTILSRAGVASRREAGRIIEEGKVSLDGRVVTQKGLQIDPGEHQISVEGRPLVLNEKKYYFILNKPRNVISTVKDTHGRKKVADFFKNIKARLYPVGRLDKDTTGIILVTNDGELAHHLSHPSFEVEKEYLAIVEGELDPRKFSEFAHGIVLDGKKTAPCKVDIVEQNEENTVFRINLHEGRKRQIRRMFEAVGYVVAALDRVRYAGLTLHGLKRGEYRELTKEEIERLKKMVGMEIGVKR